MIVSWPIVLCGIAFTLVFVSLLMTIINLRTYRVPGFTLRKEGEALPLVTVCVPARNEESNIEACVQSLLASTHANLEVLVYDDQSTDHTPRILQRLCEEDSRVVRCPTVQLPQGWNGKQHACFRMSQHAKGQWMLFTDADVRFEPAAIATALTAAGELRAELVSTFPRQITKTFAEAAIVPMIFFILFSYLPMPRMRASMNPAKSPNIPSSAGCGQFLFISRRAYDASKGHAAFQDSMHDGIKLPREVRRAGFHTDLFDGTSLCSVRMYQGFAQTWRGFAKNAYEGLGSLPLLLFLTVAHAIGHLFPWAAAIWALLQSPVHVPVLALSLATIALAYAQRSLLAARFEHSAVSVLVHPLGISLMTIIQWHSYYLSLTGQRAWRGRVQGGAPQPARNSSVQTP